MQLPKFLIGDNTDFPEDIFIINLVNDEIEWLEDVAGENEDELTNEINDLIEKASLFYDREMERYQE